MDEANGGDPSRGGSAEPYDWSLIVGLLLRQQEHYIRVQETVRSGGPDSLHREIEFLIDLHPDGGEVPLSGPSQADGQENTSGTFVTIPVVRFRKDRLMNESPITGSDGQQLLLFSRQQSQTLHAHLIQHQVLSKLRTWTEGSPLRRDAALSIARLLATVPFDNVKEANETLNQVFSKSPLNNRPEMNNLPDDARQARIDICRQLDREDSVKSLCSQFATHAYIMARLPVSGERHVTIRVSYDSVLARRERPGSIPGKFRRWFDQLPHQYQIHVPLGLKAQSYHLWVIGPDDHFVREQSFRVPSQATVAGSGGDLEVVHPDSRGTILGRPTRRNNIAHLYCGRLWLDDAKKLYASVTFFERPPGFQGVACFVSGLMTFFLASYLLVLPAFLTGVGAVDFASLILLSPGIAASVFLPSLFTAGIRQSPIGARLTIAGTILISLTATLVLTVAEAAGQMSSGPMQAIFKSGIGLLIAWGLLLILQAFSFVLSGWNFVRAYGAFKYAVGQEATRGKILNDRYTQSDYEWLTDL